MVPNTKELYQKRRRLRLEAILKNIWTLERSSEEQEPIGFSPEKFNEGKDQQKGQVRLTTLIFFYLEFKIILCYFLVAIYILRWKENRLEAPKYMHLKN